MWVVIEWTINIHGSQQSSLIFVVFRLINDSNHQSTFVEAAKIEVDEVIKPVPESFARIFFRNFVFPRQIALFIFVTSMICVQRCKRLEWILIIFGSSIWADGALDIQVPSILLSELRITFSFSQLLATAWFILICAARKHFPPCCTLTFPLGLVSLHLILSFFYDHSLYSRLQVGIDLDK